MKSAAMDRARDKRAADGESARREPETGVVRRVSESGPRTRSSAPGWRCLEWPEPTPKSKSSTPPRVSVAQQSLDTGLLRHTGPDTWLPQAGEFVHRLALLVAQGLGFDRCERVTVRGYKNVLAVTEVGSSRVVAVSGPLDAMAHVLRKSGLE